MKLAEIIFISVIIGLLATFELPVLIGAEFDAKEVSESVNQRIENYDRYNIYFE